MQSRVGVFASDLATSQEISNMLRVGELMGADMMYADQKLFTPHRVTSVLNQMSSCVRRRCHVRGRVDEKVWILRDKNKYIAMSSNDLYQEYVKTRSNVAVQLKAVNND